MTDPGRIFAAAQKAFAGGDAAGALVLLDRLPASVGGDPGLLHFRALALKGAGKLPEARDTFERAHRAAPRDAQVANNYANLLKQTGEAAAALPLYDQAIALRPDYRDARFNRALTLQTLGRLAEALAAIDALLVLAPGDARARSARGTILLALGRHDEAADAFDAVLAAGQPLPTALRGRARIALERGEADAVARFGAAQASASADPDVLLGLAEAMEADGDPAAIALMAQGVVARPDWVEGLERLARMRAEAGDPDFADHYDAALDSGAGDVLVLRLSLAKVLADADRHAEALAALVPLGEDPQFAILRAFYLGEQGQAQAGLDLLGHPEGADGAMMEGRLAIASGDLDRAAAALDRAVAGAPDAMSIWAHRELLWRATGDPRAQWLSGQDGLVAARSIGIGQDELTDIAQMLRGLHRTRAHPIGQSLRGGTQTRGRLFLRREPEIRRLHTALSDAIADHVRALPPVDPDHPLLKHRAEALTIAGSWSVRLTSSGFHVHHIHPEGLLSSACYIALPRHVEQSPTRDGWLEIGRPPAALNLALEPLTTIAPAPGRLALFPSYLYHGTRPFADGERLTVAFDVVTGG